MGALKFHAIVFYSTFPNGQDVTYHSTHRSKAAAARSLSKAISGMRSPGPGWNGYAAVVTPSNDVLSLRQAQGKVPGTIGWANLCDDMIRIAAHVTPITNA